MANQKTSLPMVGFNIYQALIDMKGNARKGRKLDTVFYAAGTDLDYVWRSEYLHWLGGPIIITKERQRKGSK